LVRVVTVSSASGQRGDVLTKSDGLRSERVAGEVGAGRDADAGSGIGRAEAAGSVARRAHSPEDLYKGFNEAELKRLLELHPKT
jgi:hypothetical protein